MFFECQKCGFVFERYAEPSACPQCSAQFILPRPAPEAGSLKEEEPQPAGS